MRSNEIEARKKELRVTNVQKEILTGILLGDACLETQNCGRTYRLKIEQGSSHRPYVDHLYQIFRDWTLSPPRERIVSLGNKVFRNVCFSTLSFGGMRFFAHQFYQSGRKVVPKLIHRWLTPKALAYWWMDDGSAKSAQSKGVLFNTQGFSIEDVDRLISVLKRNFLLNASRRRQKDGWQIYVSGKDFENLVALIGPHLIPEMRYKLPKERVTALPKM